ncbi:hypothetical protein DLP14_14450 [Salmonella enterica]|nr:hypothetical protein [Salmonella enterica]
MVLTRKDITFVGADYWSRPVFRGKRNIYYCSTEQLIHGNETQEQIEAILQNISDGKDSLYIKGRDPEGEPDYPVKYTT